MTNHKPAREPIWLPIAISVAVVLGLLIGNRIAPDKYITDNDRKINAILTLINRDYVDSTNLKDLIETVIEDAKKAGTITYPLRTEGYHQCSNLLYTDRL